MLNNRSSGNKKKKRKEKRRQLCTKITSTECLKREGEKKNEK